MALRPHVTGWMQLIQRVVWLGDQHVPAGLPLKPPVFGAPRAAWGWGSEKDALVDEFSVVGMGLHAEVGLLPPPLREAKQIAVNFAIDKVCAIARPVNVNKYATKYERDIVTTACLLACLISWTMWGLCWSRFSGSDGWASRSRR